MRNVIKLFMSIVVIFSLIVPSFAFAGEAKTIYSDDGKLRAFFVQMDNGIQIPYGSSVDDIDYAISVSEVESGKKADGSFSYPNYDSSKLGTYDLQWVFASNNPSYGKISGIIKADVVFMITNTTSDDEDATTSLAESGISMVIDSSYTPHLQDMIDGSEYTWSSSDKSIATVNKKTGKITAKSDGVATISCKVDTPYDDTYSIKLTVTVGTGKTQSKAPMKAAVTDNTIYLSPGDKQTLTPSFDPATSTCMFKSSKTSIVQVDAYTGQITAKKAGEAYITCTITSTDYSVRTIRYNIVVE